jgi:hypothetical protein
MDLCPDCLQHRTIPLLEPEIQRQPIGSSELRTIVVGEIHCFDVNVEKAAFRGGVPVTGSSANNQKYLESERFFHQTTIDLSV